MMICRRSVSACSLRLFAIFALATSSNCAACVSLLVTGEAAARTGGFSSFGLAFVAAALPVGDAAGFCVLVAAPGVVGTADFGAGTTGAVTGGGAGAGAGALAFGVGSAGVVGGVADAVAASTGGATGGGVALAV